jgi:hypothetical protein
VDARHGRPVSCHLLGVGHSEPRLRPGDPFTLAHSVPLDGWVCQPRQDDPGAARRFAHTCPRCTSRRGIRRCSCRSCGRYRRRRRPYLDLDLDSVIKSTLTAPTVRHTWRTRSEGPTCRCRSTNTCQRRRIPRPRRPGRRAPRSRRRPGTTACSAMRPCRRCA